jgi:hypothetical protein
MRRGRFSAGRLKAEGVHGEAYRGRLEPPGAEAALKLTGHPAPAWVSNARQLLSLENDWRRELCCCSNRLHSRRGRICPSGNTPSLRWYAHSRSNQTGGPAIQLPADLQRFGRRASFPIPDYHQVRRSGRDIRLSISWQSQAVSRIATTSSRTGRVGAR